MILASFVFLALFDWSCCPPRSHLQHRTEPHSPSAHLYEEPLPNLSKQIIHHQFANLASATMELVEEEHTKVRIATEQRRMWMDLDPLPPFRRKRRALST